MDSASLYSTSLFTNSPRVETILRSSAISVEVISSNTTSLVSTLSIGAAINFNNAVVVCNGMDLVINRIPLVLGKCFFLPH